MPEDQGQTQREMTILEQVKDLRVRYSELEKYLRHVSDKTGRGPGGREFSLAITELQSSRHWLGEVLGSLGEENPYKE